MQDWAKTFLFLSVKLNFAEIVRGRRKKGAKSQEKAERRRLYQEGSDGSSSDKVKIFMFFNYFPSVTVHAHTSHVCLP